MSTCHLHISVHHKRAGKQRRKKKKTTLNVTWPFYVKPRISPQGHCLQPRTWAESQWVSVFLNERDADD